MLQGQYSLPNLIKEFYNNEKAIYAYLKGEKHENFDTIDMNDPNFPTISPIDITIDTTTINTGMNILGFGIGLFLVLLLVSLVIWVWALYALIKFWNNISDIVKILGILALLTGVGGPILTLILVYATKTVQPIAPVSQAVFPTEVLPASAEVLPTNVGKKKKNKKM